VSVRLRPDRVLRVLLKEIAEARRDRNLWINVVLIPLFLYPVLGFAFFQVFLMIRGMSEREVTVIAVDPRAPAAVTDSLAASEQVEVVPLPPGLLGPGGRPDPESFRRARAAASDSAAAGIQAALHWEPDGEGAGPVATVVYDRSRDRSAGARDRILAAIEGWEAARARDRMTAVGLAGAALEIWPVEVEDTASAEERGRRVLSLALPMILLLMLAQGTFYSALDAVVGERERGTWETLLTTPLSRGEALLGKFLFVTAASVAALALNLASLTLFLGFLLQIVGEGAESIAVSVSPGAIALILVTALLTAAVISALLMILAAPARTYREGQATLTPAYLAILVPGLLVSFQRGGFTLEQAGIPVLNSVALFKSALLGEFPPGPIALALAVLAASAAAALLIASRLVGREEIWFDPTMTLRRMLTGRGGGRR
jgi:sodium transport system permease protein